VTSFLQSTSIQDYTVFNDLATSQTVAHVFWDCFFPKINIVVVLDILYAMFLLPKIAGLIWKYLYLLYRRIKNTLLANGKISNGNKEIPLAEKPGKQTNIQIDSL